MRKLGQRGETITLILYALAAAGSAAGLYLTMTGEGSPSTPTDHRQLTGPPPQSIMMQTGSGFEGVQTFEMQPGKKYTVELVNDRIVVKEGIVCELPEIKK